MTATLSEITGWDVKKKVPSEILSRNLFKRYVETHTQGRSQTKEIHAEEIALKMFGLVPQDFNLAQSTVDLLGEQAAAYYDYKKKRLFLLDSTPEGEEQQMALVHELAHALADQHHPLGKYLNHGSPSDDESTAREAVMEGQAQWLTWAYESKVRGGPAELPARYLDQLTKEEDPSPDFPVISASPLYIRESLLFPYNQGTRFQDAVYRKFGRQAFEQVFDHEPDSTHQILHPADYFKDSAHTNPEPPSLSAAGLDPKQFRAVIEGSVGEFDESILLQQYVGESEAKDQARHWSGGWFRIYEHKGDKYPVLTYTAEWDSPEAAQAYFEFYQQILQGKWKQMKVSSRSHSEISGAGDSGKFIVRLDGSKVESIEGLK